jgi:hypothetical protein
VAAAAPLIVRGRARLNLALLVPVVALAAWWIITAERAGTENAATPASLTGLSAEAVRRIQITRPDGSVTTLQRQPDGWHLRAPVAGRVEASEVAPLLRLATAPSRRQIPVDAIDRVQAGLQPPAWRIGVNDQRLAIGDNIAVDNRRYVQIGDTVHLVDEPATQALGPDYAHFLARRLLPEGLGIASIDLPDHRITRTGSGTLQIAATPADISGSDLANTIDAWSRARALWIEPADSPPEGPAVTIRLDNGEQRRFIVTARQPALALYAPDQAVTYHLPAHQAAALLDLRHPDSVEAASPLKRTPDVALPPAPTP